MDASRKAPFVGWRALWALLLGLVILSPRSARADTDGEQKTGVLLGISRDGARFAVLYAAPAGVTLVVYDIARRKQQTVCGGEGQMSPPGCANKRQASKHPAVRRLGLTMSGVTTGTSRAGMRTRVSTSGEKLVFEVTKGGRRLLSAQGERESNLAYRVKQVYWASGSKAVLFYVLDGPEAAFYGFLLGQSSVSAQPSEQGIRSDWGRVTVGGRTVKVILTTSSTLFEGNAKRYRPSNVLGASRPWCEGGPGPGIGEKISLTFKPPVRISGFAIEGGFFRSQRLWRANNRVKRLLIVTSSRTSFRVTLPDTRSQTTVRLPNGPETVSWVSFVIRAVYKGASQKTNDTCISTIKPF